MIEHVTGFIPADSKKLLDPILESYSGKLKVVPPRSTKLGDFRVNHSTSECRITINNNLNPYSFLITLIHELGHYHVWKAHGRKAKPHGVEWQNSFKELVKPFINAHVFPDSLTNTLNPYFKKPKASSCSDVDLVKALAEFDPDTHLIYVSDLPLKTRFTFRRMGTFEVVGKRRTRIICEHVEKRKNYLFSPVALVDPCLPVEILV